MKIDKLAKGQIVYDVCNRKIGNTSMTTTCVFEVQIKTIDFEKEKVTASWNGNKPQVFFKNAWSKWRLKKPILIKTSFGHRLAKRGET